MKQSSKIVMTMRKFRFFATLVVAMAVVSCAQEIENEAPAINDGAVTFEATFDAVGSRALLIPGAEASKVEWEAGDEVGVLVGAGNYLYEAATAGATTTLNTEATDVPTEGDYYALYPYNATATLAEGVISTTLPAEQAAVEGSFTTHLAVAKAVDNKFAFKNVCGLVMVDLNADVSGHITKIVFEGNNGEIVAGDIDVTVATAPTWTGTGATSVTLLPADGATSIAEGRYFFAVLPQTFEKGFKVTAYSGDNAWEIRNVTTEVTIERAGIVAGKEFNGEGSEADPYLLRTADDMVDMYNVFAASGKTEVYFKMVNNIDMTGVTNYVPVNYENGSKQIHFDGGNNTLSNWKLDQTVEGAFTDVYPSLFGVLYGSCKNLKIDNAYIKSVGNVAGIIGGYVGTTNKPGLVENVTVTNSTVISNNERAGGLCGEANTATFKKCNVDVTVASAGTDTGGIAGKTNNSATFTDCNVKANVSSTIAGNTRIGGFIGWNNASKTTITNCHVLEGSLVHANGTSHANQARFGGFIGYGDKAGAVLTISNSSSAADVECAKSAFNSGFVAYFGSKNIKVTITNCYATGDVTAEAGGGNYNAGLIGHIDQSEGVSVTITDCYYSGTVTGGKSYVGGILGGTDGPCNLVRTYSTGTVKARGAGTNNQYVGGLIGAAMNSDVSVTDCWSSATVYGEGQQVGGLVGTATQTINMSNCFALGDVTSNTSGSAGIIGRVQRSSTVKNCIAWNKNIVCKRSGTNKYAPGAILGCAQAAGTYSGCWRRWDMDLTDSANATDLKDQDDYINSTPPQVDGAGTHSCSYHGKAAATDATISSVAKTLGWSTDVWDLTGDIPVLK